MNEWQPVSTPPEAGIRIEARQTFPLSKFEPTKPCVLMLTASGHWVRTTGERINWQPDQWRSL